MWHVPNFYFLELIKPAIWLWCYQFLEKHLKRSIIILNGRYFYQSIKRINTKLVEVTYILLDFGFLWVKYWESYFKISHHYSDIFPIFDILLYILWFCVFWPTGIHAIALIIVEAGCWVHSSTLPHSVSFRICVNFSIIKIKQY